MADRHLEAAAEALHERWPRLGILSRAVVRRHPSKVEIADVALTAYLDSLLGELPEEALRASQAETGEDWWVIREHVAAFLRVLRDSLASGREGGNDDG